MDYITFFIAQKSIAFCFSEVCKCTHIYKTLYGLLNKINVNYVSMSFYL